MKRKKIKCIVNVMLLAFCVSATSMLCLCVDGCSWLETTSETVFMADGLDTVCGINQVQDSAHTHTQTTCQKSGHCCSGHCPILPIGTLNIANNISKAALINFHNQIVLSLFLQDIEKPPRSLFV
jgi:hypothetical protein